MQNDLVENCRKWIANYHDANAAVVAIEREMELAIRSHFREKSLIDFQVELKCKLKEEVWRYAQKGAVINS
jgi:hypothetical protein